MKVRAILNVDHAIVDGRDYFRGDEAILEEDMAKSLDMVIVGSIVPPAPPRFEFRRNESGQLVRVRVP